VAQSNEKDSGGWFSACMAAYVGKIEALKILVEYGADIDEKTVGKTYLSFTQLREVTLMQ